MKNHFLKIKDFLKGKNSFIIMAIVIAFIVLLAPIQKVEIGHEGVTYNSLNGKISANHLPGWHMVLPFAQQLTSYPVFDRAYKIHRDLRSWNNGIDASITTSTSDNQLVSIDATFVYALERDQLCDIFERFSGMNIDGIERVYLDDIFRASIINTVSQYSVFDIYSTKRNEIQILIFEELKSLFSETGINLKFVYIETVRLSAEMESIIRSEALAEAARIEAQGRSDANKIISDSLTEQIMMHEALGRLSETLRLIIVPSGTDSTLDFSRIIEQVLGEFEDIMVSE
ncbi:MAG: SPFH domain-containing protein [Lachnospiraceae bacterium]|nr:SPFH domain-containing protein [Lachnospiraceae bacterium]